MKIKVDPKNYQIYPSHLRREMFEIDQQYEIVSELLNEGRLFQIRIPDFPLSCALLTELFFGKNSKKT